MECCCCCCYYKKKKKTNTQSDVIIVPKPHFNLIQQQYHSNQMLSFRLAFENCCYPSITIKYSETQSSFQLPNHWYRYMVYVRYTWKITFLLISLCACHEYRIYLKPFSKPYAFVIPYVIQLTKFYWTPKKSRNLILLKLLNKISFRSVWIEI